MKTVKSLLEGWNGHLDPFDGIEGTDLDISTETILEGVVYY